VVVLSDGMAGAVTVATGAASAVAGGTAAGVLSVVAGWGTVAEFVCAATGRQQASPIRMMQVIFMD
jgi:hypothetical protein